MPCGAPHCSGVSRVAAWALEQVHFRKPGHAGLLALRPMESSQTRDQTCVPCPGRGIPILCSTREVPCSLSLYVHIGIRRQLLLGRKAMTNLHSVLKSRDISLPTEVRLVKATVFPVVTSGCESCPVKKTQCQRTDAFELWCWRRLLRLPWTVHPKGNQP